jgi:hypothetical protein
MRQTFLPVKLPAIYTPFAGGCLALPVGSLQVVD